MIGWHRMFRPPEPRWYEDLSHLFEEKPYENVDSWSCEEDGEPLLEQDNWSLHHSGYRPRVMWDRHPLQRDLPPPRKP